MADSEDAKRCRAFYRKHRAALDLIRDQVYQQRVRLMAEARRLLEEEVKSNDHLELDQSTNAEIGFVSRNVDKELPKGGTATKTGRILLFFLWIEQVGISFAVSVGPGDDDARRELFRIAGIAPMKPQINLDGFLKTKWNTVYKRQLVGAEDYSLERDDFVKKLKDEWNAVKADDLPKIESAIHQGRKGAVSGTATPALETVVKL